MQKEKFYIYQEDLIQTPVMDEVVTISGFVGYLNKMYCKSNMKKMRCESIYSFLHKKRYIEIKDDVRIPTKLGILVGIYKQEKVNDLGQKYECLVLSDKAQQMLLDNFYNIIN